MVRSSQSFDDYLTGEKNKDAMIEKAHHGQGQNPQTAHAYEVTRYGDCRSCANFEKAPVVCPVGPQFGEHGGAQWRANRYFFKCGCDAGYCENHAKPRLGDPLGPKFEPGHPRKCRKHSKGAKS